MQSLTFTDQHQVESEAISQRTDFDPLCPSALWKNENKRARERERELDSSSFLIQFHTSLSSANLVLCPQTRMFPWLLAIRYICPCIWDANSPFIRYGFSWGGLSIRPRARVCMGCGKDAEERKRIFLSFFSLFFLRNAISGGISTLWPGCNPELYRTWCPG